MTDLTKLTRLPVLITLSTLLLISHVNCSLDIFKRERSWFPPNQSNHYEEQSDVSTRDKEITADHLSDHSIRYVIFSSVSHELPKQSIENIRLISIYQEQHPNSYITISSTANKNARLKAKEIKTLIEKFGIPKDHLQLIVERDFSHATDTTLMIQIRDKVLEDQFEIIAIN